ncbi:RagB/SusD family nutrient uptake outer membrane protein [Pseudozobellia sp. WGM2]|uniref:RagB/SusD family nutrient uptake outer membrane protein n=1 Tax=Pseudozobellia sp. WGM2 TaxID=2787625 RepID=UPI001AE02B04|nr:RagB/SusD family nutrient uptake outer membrane protein [Pseudozobellia sp. WGM2]
MKLIKNLTKKSKWLLGFAAICLIAASCSDLDENPDFSSSNAFYKSENDALTALNGAYDNLGREWFNTMYARFCFDCILGYSTGYEKQPLNYASGALTPGDGVLASYWDISYKAINDANNIITNVPDIEMDETKKSRIIGEAKFLRGYFYYHLAVYFDDIPVYTEPTTSFDAAASNEDGKQRALNQAIADFIDASAALPPSYSGGDLGRATKWAALGFLSKTYLETGQFNEARDAAENVIDNSGLTLFDDFSFNFDVEHENMGERLFEIQFSYAADPNKNSNFLAHFSPTDWAGPDAENQTAAAAGWADAWIWGEPEFRMTYDDEDARIPGTFVESYYSRNVNDQVTWDPNAKSNFVGSGSTERTYRSAYVVKYLETEPSSWDNTERNFPALRLSDVMLAHSEAANESGQGDAYLGINTVRARASLPPLSGLSKQDLKDAIVQERAWEFAFEGQTFITLKRAGVEYIADYVNTYTNRAADVDGRKDAVLPIPNQEVNANTLIEQNALWK